MCAQDGLTPAFVCGVLQLLEEEVYSLMLFPYLKQWQFFFCFWYIASELHWQADKSDHQPYIIYFSR